MPPRWRVKEHFHDVKCKYNCVSTNTVLSKHFNSYFSHHITHYNVPNNKACITYTRSPKAKIVYKSKVVSHGKVYNHNTEDAKKWNKYSLCIIANTGVQFQDVVANEPNQIRKVGRGCLITDKFEHRFVFHPIHIECQRSNSNAHHTFWMVEEFDCLRIQWEVICVLYQTNTTHTN